MQSGKHLTDLYGETQKRRNSSVGHRRSMKNEGKGRYVKIWNFVSNKIMSYLQRFGAIVHRGGIMKKQRERNCSDSSEQHDAEWRKRAS